MNDSKILIKIINDSKLLINKEINTFLYCLIMRIFLKKRNKKASIKANENLKLFIDKINKEIIKDINKKISEEYTTNNLSNIFEFVKTQNTLFASEIIENILIVIFSFAFKTEKIYSFGKLLYNDMELIKKLNNLDLINWLLLNKFNENVIGREKENFKMFLESDFSAKNNVQSKNQNKNQLEQINKTMNQPIISLILNINNEKFEISNNDKKKENKNLAKTKSNSKIPLSNLELITNYFFKGEIGKVSKIPISIFKALLFSVYIYYQNKKSPLMEYIHESFTETKLSIIPFEYNLSEAVIDSNFSSIIFSPIRIEPRIEHIKMYKNYLKKNSLIEFSKVLLFNKNIKKIDFHTCMIKSDYIHYLNYFSKFNNYSIEELNISFNFLKEDSSEFLAHLLLHLKNLKTLILSSNDLKRGISSFLIILKNLYRKQKTKLESLYLNNCFLDDIAFYELGEMLKSKYCKLKYLYLNTNNIPSNVKFLKKLKKNNSLIEIYFNNNNIENKDADDIMKVISNTRINCLYLMKNKLTNFSQLIRIIYRTRLIKSEGGEELGRESFFYNLDLSENPCYNKNKAKIDLFKQAIKETTLYCLDFCHILYNLNPDKIKISEENKDYRKAVDSLKINLEKERNELNQISFMENNLNIDIKNINVIENKELFIEMEEDIIDIIDKEEAKFPLYIKKKVPKLLFNYEKTREIILHEGELDNKEYKKISDNLEKYIKLKLLKQNLKKLENEKNKIKIIII